MQCTKRLMLKNEVLKHFQQNLGVIQLSSNKGDLVHVLLIY